ncbi:hypothetical protein JXA85_02550 [Candidatus Woesearchaeota archaeon]|nr:hypothetical protein [Candidatus Woesearchaeota archaeon]
MKNLLNILIRTMQIVKDINPDDVIFFACALAYDNSILWSDDKKLKNQTKVKVLNAQEMNDVLSE